MVQLFHSLDSSNPESFTSRGNVSVLSINTGELLVNQKELSQKDRNTLIELAKKDKFYRLKADVVGSDGVKTTFLTSSKAVSPPKLTVENLRHDPVNHFSVISSNLNSTTFSRSHWITTRRWLE